MAEQDLQQELNHLRSLIKQMSKENLDIKARFSQALEYCGLMSTDRELTKEERSMIEMVKKYLEEPLPD